MLRLFRDIKQPDTHFHARLASTSWVNPFGVSSSAIRKLLLFSLCTSSALRAEATLTNYNGGSYTSVINTTCTTPAFYGNVTETCLVGRNSGGGKFRIDIQVSPIIDINGLNNALANCKIDHNQCHSDDPKINLRHSTCVEDFHNKSSWIFPPTIYTFGNGEINGGKCSVLNYMVIGADPGSYFARYMGDLAGCTSTAIEKYCDKARKIEDVVDTYFPLEDIQIDHTTRDIILILALSGSAAALASIGLVIWHLKHRNNNGYVKLDNDIEAGIDNTPAVIKITSPVHNRSLRRHSAFSFDQPSASGASSEQNKIRRSSY